MIARELDVVDASDPKNLAVAEIKYSTMFHADFARSINAIAPHIHAAEDERYVILRGGNRRTDAAGVKVLTAQQWLDRN